jgi:hypothetical protein
MYDCACLHAAFGGSVLSVDRFQTQMDEYSPVTLVTQDSEYHTIVYDCMSDIMNFRHPPIAF